MDDAKDVAAVQSDDLRRAIEEGDEELQRALELSLQGLDGRCGTFEHDETFTATTGANKDTIADGGDGNTSDAETLENNTENDEAKTSGGDSGGTTSSNNDNESSGEAKTSVDTDDATTNALGCRRLGKAGGALRCNLRRLQHVSDCWKAIQVQRLR